MADPGEYNDLSGLATELTHPKLEDSAGETVLADLFESLLLDEVTELVVNSRPPRLYLFGRSGVGKSSLLNALAGRSVAEVGHIEPTTGSSEIYDVGFDNGSEWRLVDSRGLFESIPANGEVRIEEMEAVARDIEAHNPDLLLHVTTPRHARAGSDEQEAIEHLQESIVGGLPPRVVCLNKIDTLCPPNQAWPPKQNSTTANQILDALRLVADMYNLADSRPLVEESPHCGILFDSGPVAGVVPTYVRSEPYWNLNTLTMLLTDRLPQEARFQFTRAARRKRLMRRLAREQTQTIANAVEKTSEFRLPTIPATLVLQRYLVALIGSFSGRDLGYETVQEYFDAVDDSGRGSPELRAVLARASRIVPSHLVGRSTDFAAKQTYRIGRSAEAYFFDDELIHPKEFRDEPK